jgi:hypothetical protein
MVVATAGIAMVGNARDDDAGAGDVATASASIKQAERNLANVMATTRVREDHGIASLAIR